MTGCLGHELAQVEFLAGDQDVGNVLGLDDADDLVGIAVDDRQARMDALLHRLGNLGGVIGEIDHVDVVARRHDGADRTVAQAHDAGDHRALLAFDHAGGLGFGNQHLDFFLGDLRLRGAALAEKGEHETSRYIEEPDEGARDLRQEHHGRCDRAGNGFGIAQRDLLRHQFADDQREIGNGGDDDAEGDRIGIVAVEAGGFETAGEPRAERRTGDAPARMPTKVIPTWTVERKRPGSEASAKARREPRTPRSIMAFRRAGRAETTANSDMASALLMRIRTKISASSAINMAA